MASTVTIYRITLTKSPMGEQPAENYSLSPWGHNSAIFQGHDDGGRAYRLPEGYAVGDDGFGETVIWDPRGYPCTLGTEEGAGRPQLVSERGAVTCLDPA